MIRPLRFIQIGTGGMGKNWCEIVWPRLIQQKKATPVAAVDIVPEHLVNATELLGLDSSRCYTDISRAFAENEADFAVVVVPPAHHEEVVNTALAHDCHILSEKPIADTLEATARIYKSVTAAGKKMAVTMSHRFDRDKQTLERLVKSGEYGDPSHVVGRNTWNCRKFPAWGAFRYKIPHTLLVEGTVHHFDILRALTGSNAQSIYAVSWNPPWSEFEGDANVLITLGMENGIKVMYEGSKTSATTLNGWGGDYFRVECDRATLELDNREIRVMHDADSGERSIVEKQLLFQDAWKNPWLAEMYCDWMLGLRPDHPAALEDNIQCMAILFAAIESVETGTVVDVQEFLKKSLTD